MSIHQDDLPVNLNDILNIYYRIALLTTNLNIMYQYCTINHTRIEILLTMITDN